MFSIPVKPMLKVLISLSIVFLVMPVLAGEYKLLREGDPTEKAYFLDTTGVCTAMEQNLKKFQDRPYGMACKRELDPSLGFTRPKWERLDVMQHLPLVVAIMRYNHWADTFLSQGAKLWPSQIRELVEKRQFGMDLAHVDLDGDGNPENLVRFGFELPSCVPEEQLNGGMSSGHRPLYVIDATFSKVDPYSDHIGFPIVDDVFLFKGKVYTDVFYGMPLSARPSRKFDGELKIYEFGKKWVADICTYHYLDTNAIQGGK